MKSSDLNRFSDTELIAQIGVFNNAVIAAPTTYGLTDADGDALQTALTNLQTMVNNLLAARAAADAAQQTKDNARSDTVALARSQMKVARAVPGIKSDDLATANLDPYDTTATASIAPGTAPVGMVDFGKLQHIIRFRDSATPDSSKKPDGVMGCEIWVKLDGPPPADEKECTFLALDTATPYTTVYSGADGGKMAHYLLRWVSTSGEKGQWSEVVSATINA
jgi:hypothetical protein